MDGWMDGWMDRWMDGRTDGRTDGRILIEEQVKNRWYAQRTRISIHGSDSLGRWRIEAWLNHVYVTYQEGIRNRSEQAEPNRTEAFNSGTGRNRTRNKTEPNRTEPRRVRKSQAEQRRTGKVDFPNRTEPNRWIVEKLGKKRIDPNRLLPDLWAALRELDGAEDALDLDTLLLY